MTLDYNGFFKRVNSPPDDYIEVFISDWNKEHWAFYVFIDVENYEDSLDEITDLISTDRLNHRDGDFYVELIDHSEQDFTEKLYKKFLENSGLDHNCVLWSNNWEEHTEEIQNEPPAFSDFKDAWHVQEYLEEMIGKERFYDVMYSWLSGSDIRLMYDRFNGGLL